MIRVLIAEDSATVQALLVEALGADPAVVIVGTAVNGREAVEMTKRLRPDVVAMDIVMPEMDGFAATKQIMIEMPTPIVIMSASVDLNEVSISMAALRAGAVALIEKPTMSDPDSAEAAIRHLVFTVKAMAGIKVIHHWPRVADASPPETRRTLCPATRVRVVAIAASTGGAAALARILSGLPAHFPAPILVVQHIAKGFMEGLVGWLGTVASLRVKVAEDAEVLAPSTVYFAADDRHVGVTADSRIVLSGAEPVNGFRPSADVMFDSVGTVFARASVGVILTGMGSDGVEGLRTLRANGGQVIAQDEASSVVFGMPSAAIDAGVVNATLPLSLIDRELIRIVDGA